MSLQEFSAVFSLLAVQLRATDADEATMRGYFLALEDLPLAAVAASAKKFARDPDRRFFPTSAEWYQAAQGAGVEVLRRTLTAVRDAPWRHTCEACEDTGWSQRIACPGDETCGRSRAHAAHDFVRMCPCRPTNATWLRHQTFGRGAS